MAHALAGRRTPSTRIALPSPDTSALVVVALAVVVANLSPILGLFHLDPMPYRGGLAVHITPGLLGGRPTIDPSNGFNAQALGHLAANDLLHLRLPWWNPFEGTGMPLLGETESAALFPPTLLTALANGQLWEHLLLEMVAGICTYRLLRRLQVTSAAAVAGAVAFALCGKFAWFTDATVNPLAFLPMLLLGVERAFDAAQNGRRAGWRLIALAGALTAYAGFPEVAYPDVVLVAVWSGWRAGCLPGMDRARFVAKLCLGAAGALLLAAPMLVAMVGDISHAALAIHAGDRLGSLHLQIRHWPQLLLPYVYGPINGTAHGIWGRVGGYLSTVLVLFAALGLLTPGRRGLKFLLLAWALLVFAHMYREPTLLSGILGGLPAMSRTEFFRYATAALELPIIVLAALGLDDLTRPAAHRRRLMFVAVLALGAVGAAALTAAPEVRHLSSSVRHAHAFLWASVGWGALTAAAAGMIALIRPVRARATLLALLVIVDAIALFAVPALSGPRADPIDLRPVSYLQRHLGEGRFDTLGPIVPNYGSYFHLASINLTDFPPKSYVHFLHTRLDPFMQFVGYQLRGVPSPRQELLRHIDGYRAASVRYVITRARRPLPTAGTPFLLVFRDRTTRIYRLAGARAFFTAAGCRVVSPDLDRARLDCRRPTVLIRRETWFPGWSAEIDGRRARVHRIDGLFQAVDVPAGVHTVTFGFMPVGMDWAIGALLAGCVLVLVPTARGRGGAGMRE